MEQLIRDGNIKAIRGQLITLDDFKKLIWIGPSLDKSKVLDIGVVMINKLVEAEQTREPPRRSLVSRLLTRRQAPIRMTLREKLDGIKESVRKWLERKFAPPQDYLMRSEYNIQREKQHVDLLDEIVQRYEYYGGLGSVPELPREVTKSIVSKYLGSKRRRRKTRRRINKGRVGTT
jgi:hypothetical protein